MKHTTRITAVHRDPIDLDRLATALLAIVGDLNPKTRARLAAQGQKRLDALNSNTPTESPGDAT